MGVAAALLDGRVLPLIILGTYLAKIHTVALRYKFMKEHTMDMDKYSSQLKSKGLKVTSARVTVLEIFNQSNARHLSAEDVYKKVLEHEGDIGLATVYRVLTQFADAGILVATNFETGKTTFELNEGGHHDHLVLSLIHI